MGTPTRHGSFFGGVEVTSTSKGPYSSSERGRYYISTEKVISFTEVRGEETPSKPKTDLTRVMTVDEN